MMPFLRLALAQINPVMGAFEANIAKITDYLKRAEKAQPDLVVFPEMCLCGYPPEDLLLKPGFLQDNQEALHQLAAQVGNLPALAGFADQEAGRAFNAAAVLHQGQVKSGYRKIELPNYGVFDEKRYFQSGDQHLFLDFGSMRVAVTICEDIWVPEGEVERSLQGRQPDLVINISASPFYAGKIAVRRQIVTGLAQRLGCHVAYCNLVGGQDELVFDGGSMLAGPDGRLLGQAPRFVEDLFVVEVPLSAAFSPARGTRCASASQSLAGVHCSLPLASGRETAGLQPPMAPGLSEVEEIHAALILGTRDYIRKNGFKQVVVGLSGGIDSALVAALAVEAVGRENVTTVTMPSPYTSQATLADAQQLAENLGVRLLTMPIEPIFAVYRASLEKVWEAGKPGLEYENLQARIRGNLLMACSNRYGWLVLTTGNKSEIATGYCTLYGDMAGGFAVIKDVPKTLVYKLARYVNEKAGRDLIPSSVLDRPPTAELRPNQKDEDSLPPYATLDPILQAYVEEDKSFDEIVARGFATETVREVTRLVDRSEYKRRQSPPGVKITPKAFGRDWRLPITNQYKIEGRN